jgi:hypothetical protein
MAPVADGTHIRGGPDAQPSAAVSPDQGRWTQDGEYDEHSRAADPIGSGLTSPALCAHFIHINPGAEITTQPNATSGLSFVIRGNGRTRINRDVLP